MPERAMWPPDDEPWVAYDTECGECGVVYIWEPVYADQPPPEMCPVCAEKLTRALETALRRRDEGG